MVIFHTDHWGALAQFIVLALTRHSKEERVFIGAAGLADSKKKIVDALIENGIFTGAAYIKETFPGAFLQKKEEILNAVTSTYDADLTEQKVDLYKADKIYSVTDFQGTFRLYLLVQKN